MKIEKKSLIFLLILLIPFFKPIGPSYYSWFNILFQVWKALSIALIIALMFPKKISEISPKRTGFWGLYLFWALYIANSIWHNNGFVDILNNAVTSIVLLNFIRFSVKTGWHDKLLFALNKLFGGYVILQVLSVFLVRIGLILFEPLEADFTYFLGTDNYSAFAVYPMLAIILFYQECFGKNGRIEKSGWIISVMVVFSYLYTKSMTAAAVGIVLLLILFVRNFWRSITRYINAKTTLVFTLSILIGIQLFGVQDILSNLLENVLNKGITLNSRTYIWTAAVDLIGAKPILGYGTFSQVQLSNERILYGTSHAHNLFLELLLRTGIVGSLGYLHFVLGFEQKKVRLVRKTPANILEIFLVIQILLFTMDFYVTIQYFYCFMGITYFSKAFIAKRKVYFDEKENWSSRAKLYKVRRDN